MPLWVDPSPDELEPTPALRKTLHCVKRFQVYVEGVWKGKGKNKELGMGGDLPGVCAIRGQDGVEEYPRPTSTLHPWSSKLLMSRIRNHYTDVQVCPAHDRLFAKVGGRRAILKPFCSAAAQKKRRHG